MTRSRMMYDGIREWNSGLMLIEGEGSEGLNL